MNYLGEPIYSLVPTGGNVTGPVVSTVDGIPRFATTDGKLLKNSTATISDTGLLQGVSIIQGASNISATGTLTIDSGTVELLGLPSSLTIGTDVVADTDGTVSLTGRGTPYGIAVSGATLVTGTLTTTGQVAVSNNRITGLGAPTVDTDAATKLYVDDKFISALGSTDAAKISPVAPAGQRDLFTASIGALGGFLSGDTLIRDFVYSQGTAAVVYSIDGGLNFSPCIFDVLPVGAVSVTFSPTVVIARTTTQIYLSVNNINFILQAVTPLTGLTSIFWSTRLNFFIAGCNVSSTQRIATSPDGITWTVQTSPNFAVYTFAESTNRIVATSGTAPYSMWSDDGITWTTTVSTIAGACRGISYSPEQTIWITSTTGGVTYYSSDGKVWTPTTTGLAPAVLGRSLKWIGGTVSRWYIISSSAGGNHGLWSSPDPRIVNFVGCELDGAYVNSGVLQYDLLYDQLRGRFLITCQAPPFVLVGTPRPNDIKALSDNIRVRNSPVSVGLYSAYTDVTVDATTVETSLITASALGSTFLQAPQPLGMAITASLTLTATSSAGSTLTIRFKNGGTILASLPITVPALASQTPIVIVFNAVIQSSVATASGSAQIGTTSLVAYGSGSWSRTTGNTLAITAQWGNNTSTVIARQVVITAQFRNGA